jgi:hypothetical protein
MPLGAGQLVLGEELLVQERQLDGVGDLLDLVVEAADVGVGDVGHLLEHELLDLGPGQLLEQQARAGVEQHVSPARSRSRDQLSARARPRAPRRPGRRRAPGGRRRGPP